MHVLALVEGIGQPCYRYRLEAFAWSMAQQGLYLEAVPLRKGLLARVAQLAAARRADLVILQRKLLPLWQLALLRRAAKRLIYDVDDALFQRDSYHARGPASPTRARRFAATVRVADLVIAGNEYLREWVAAHTEACRVRVVPTCIQPQWYTAAAHARTGAAARLVWIGQRSTLASLLCIAPHLAAAAQQLPGIGLRVISDAAPQIAGIDVVRRAWSPDTEAAELAEGDIGVNWLPDDRWSPGKCGLRVLQYMAAGLPVVANPVGMNRSLVVDGETGYLASTPAEWAAAIARLAADAELRRVMGAAGRRLVLHRYSVAGWGPRLAAAVAAVARTRPPSPSWTRVIPAGTQALPAFLRGLLGGRGWAPAHGDGPRLPAPVGIPNRGNP
jgi:glycosyltransferase involved in cell wall biosynthesis